MKNLIQTAQLQLLKMCLLLLHQKVLFFVFFTDFVRLSFKLQLGGRPYLITNYIDSLLVHTPQNKKRKKMLLKTTEANRWTKNNINACRGGEKKEEEKIMSCCATISSRVDFQQLNMKQGV